MQRPVFSGFQRCEAACREIRGGVESKVGPVDWLVLSLVLVLPAQLCFILVSGPISNRHSTGPVVHACFVLDHLCREPILRHS